MNKKDINILLPAITVILAVACYLIASNLLMPKIAENTAKISALDQDIASANAKLDSIASADQSMTTLSVLVNNLLIAVPSGVNSPDLITEIESIANLNQVALPSLSPPTSIKADSSASGVSGAGLSTDLTVVGSFQNINSFINALETSIRFSKINNLTISSGDSGLSAAINFNVYSRPVSASPAAVSSDNSAGVTP